MKQERIAAMITVLGGIAIIHYAWYGLGVGEVHVPGPGFLPFLVGGGLVILGVVWAGLAGRSSKDEAGAGAEKRRWQRALLSFALMLAYAWTIERLGYLTSTFLFMLAWQKLIERERWAKTSLIALLGTASIYALFVYFLKVPLPKELFLR